MDPRYFVVFGACLTQFTVIGLFFSYGVFFKVFEEEFGWSRTFLSSCTSLSFLVMGVLAIFGGRLNDRYGPRVVLGVAGVLYGAGFLLMSGVSAQWQLLAIFALFIGVGMSSHDVVTLSTIARWFERRRGVMTGVVKVGTAAGQMAVPPLAAFLIVAIGWRDALWALGVAAVVLLFIASRALRSPPRPAAGAAGGGGAAGLDFAAARRSRQFWTICAIQFLFFPTLTTVPLHIAVHGMDLGLAPATAAMLLSVTGGASVAGRRTVGAIADRIGGRRAYVLCFTPLICALGALALITAPWSLFPAIAVYGFAHGGLFTVVSPTIAEYFGTRAHGAIFGVVVFFGTAGGAVGPILAGWAFDQTGAYTPAFVTLAAMCGLALALALTLPAGARAAATLPLGERRDV